MFTLIKCKFIPYKFNLYDQQILKAPCYPKVSLKLLSSAPITVQVRHYMVYLLLPFITFYQFSVPVAFHSILFNPCNFALNAFKYICALSPCFSFFLQICYITIQCYRKMKMLRNVLRLIKVWKAKVCDKSLTYKCTSC